jgi:hypothetical protein
MRRHASRATSARTRTAATAVTMLALIPPFPFALEAQSHELRPAAWSVSDRAIQLPAWSALTPVGDLPRPILASPPIPAATGRTRTAALFGAGSNPVLLGFVGRDTTGFLLLGFGGARGDWRRPIDEDAIRFARLDGELRTWLSRYTTLAGSIHAERAEAGTGVQAGFATAPGVSPLGLWEDASPPARHLRVAVSGAYAWQVAGWAAGLGTGLTLSEDATSATRTPRLGRGAGHVISAGVARRLLHDFHVSVFGRRSAAAETALLHARYELRSIDPVHGFADPPRDEIAPPLGYHRRADQEATASGISLHGSIRGIQLLLLGERFGRNETHFSEAILTPPANRWRARGQGVTVAAVVPLADLSLTAAARGDRISGQATRWDVEGHVFSAERSRGTGMLEVRYAPTARDWEAALALTGWQDSQDARDELAEVPVAIDGWLAGGGAEITWHPSYVWSVSVGGAYGHYGAISVIPSPDRLGRVWASYVGPETGLYSTPANLARARAMVRHRVRDTAALLLALETETGLPSTVAGLPLAPTGTRHAWRVSFGSSIVPGRPLRAESAVRP